MGKREEGGGLGSGTERAAAKNRIWTREEMGSEETRGTAPMVSAKG